MGTGTFVSKPNSNTSKKRTLQLPFDVPLLLIVVVLLVFGLLMVYSASWDFSSLVLGQEPTYVFNRQVLWVLLGAVVAGVASFVDYHHYQKVLIPLGLGTLALLLAVLIVNQQPDADEWARNLFSGSIQPSELAKAVLVIYLSFWLSRRKDDINSWQLGYIPLIMILGVTSALIMLQPDLSAAVTILILGVMLFFLAGGKWQVILLVFVAVLLLAIPLISIYPTGQARVESYLSSLNDPLQSSYHIQRTLEAVINGSWFGVGIGQADTKFTGLPLAPTDSIYAVIVEETGILGGSLIVILFVLLGWRGLVIAKNAPDQLGERSLLAFGLTAWIVLEAVMNMAVVVGLLPVTGNALPLISAGGSSMLVTLTSIGIILNVSKASAAHQNEERSAHSAVVDLRRRDGRGSVSRRHRSANPQSR